MSKAKRKIFSCALVCAMLLAAVSVFTLTGKAAEPEDDNSLLRNLGFSTDTSAFQGELTKTDEKANPLGAGTTSLTKVPELLVTSTSYWESGDYAGQWNQASVVYGKNMGGIDTPFMSDMSSIFGINNTLLEDVNRETIVDTVGGARHIRDIAFDPTGCGKENYIARLLVIAENGYSRLAFRLIDAENKWQVGTEFTLCSLPFEYFAHQTGGLVSMAAGDFNADGKDELAIYVPNFNGYPQVIIYQADTKATGQPIHWYCRYDLVSLCGLYYYEDYLANGFPSHYTRWPAVDLAVTSHKNKDMRGTDDLMIAVSPARNLHKYGAGQGWDNAPVNLATRVVFSPNPMERQGTSNAASDVLVRNMRWEWNQQSEYKSTKNVSGRWETMLFGGVANGDINGDGHDDFIIAGYRINDSHNTNNDGYAHMDKDRYLITYMLYLPDSGVYTNPVTAQWVDARQGQNYDITKELNSADNKIDNFLQPLAVAAFAERGSGYADSIFVNGVVARLHTSESPQENPFSPGDITGQFQGLIKTLYKVPTAAIVGDSGHNRWISQPTAGNFTGDPLGREKLVFIYGRKTNTGDGQVNSEHFLISVEQTGNYEKESFSVDYFPPGGYSVEDHLFRRSNDRITIVSRYGAASICAPDVDNDSRLIRFKGGEGSKTVNFSNPYVAAVLQAAPYFRDLAIEDSGYADAGSTTFAKSKSTGTSEEHNVSVVGSAIFGSEANLAIFGVSLEIEASLSAGYANSVEKETTFTTSYVGNSSDDSVVLFMTPYIDYQCEIYLPSTKVISKKDYEDMLKLLEAYTWDIQCVQAGGDTEHREFAKVCTYYNITSPPYLEQAGYKNLQQMHAQVKSKIEAWDYYLDRYDYGETTAAGWYPTVISMPQSSRQSMMTVTEYDRVAVASAGAIQPIRTENGGSILSSEPGNPSSYSGEDKVLNKWLGGTMVSAKFPTNYAGLGTGSNSISQSIEISESSSHGVSWGAGVTATTKGTYFAIKVGFSLGVEYEGGYNWISSQGTTYEGSVAGISATAKNMGYDFQWQFGIWHEQLNGEECMVLGYRVKDVKGPPSAPRNVYASNVSAKSVSISWEPGTIPGSYYAVYRMVADGVPYRLSTIMGDADSVYYTYNDNKCNPSTKYTYCVRAFTDTDQSVFSSLVEVITNPVGNVPVIIRQPEDLQSSAGNTADFSVVVKSAEGTGDILDYTWQTDSGKGWVNVPSYSANGTTTAKLSFIADERLSGNRYRCRIMQMVGNDVCVVYSNSALLTVSAGASQTALTLTDSGGAPVSYGQAKGSYSVTNDGYADVDTAIKARLNGEVMEFMRPGKLVDIAGGGSALEADPDNPNRYLRSYNLGLKFYQLEGSGITKLNNSTDEFVDLVDGDVKEITGTQVLRGDGIDDINANILAGNPVTGALTELTIAGTIYYNDAPGAEDEPRNYYVQYEKDGKTVYACIDTSGNINYYTLKDGSEYIKLTQQFVYTINTAEIEFDPSSLLQYTAPINTMVRTSTMVQQAGEPVVLTAAVSADAQEPPTGIVSFVIKNTSTGTEKTVMITLRSGDPSTASYTWIPEEAGLYNIQAYYGGGKDFLPSSDIGSYTAYIGEAETLGIDIGSQLTYGGSSTISVSLFDAGDKSSTMVTDSADISFVGPNGSSGPLSGGYFQPESAGEYLISAKYLGYSAKAAITVARAPLAVRAEDQTVHLTEIAGFNPNDNRDYLSVNGVVNGDDEGLIKDCFTLTCNFTQTTGRYAIGISYNPNATVLANYSISTIPGWLSVTSDGTPTKTVSVGNQDGTLTKGMAGSVDFAVATQYIMTSSTIILNNIKSVPGISLETPQTTGPNTTVTISTTAQTPAGTHRLSLTIDGTTSNTFNLVVWEPGSAPTFALSVSAGTGGQVTGTPTGIYEAGTEILVTAEANNSYHFVDWTVTGASITGGETANPASFTMPNGDVTLSANFEQDLAIVTGVNVSPANIEVQKGTTQQFAATVIGTNNPPQSVIWSVFPDEYSSISATGLLTVDENETETTLSVTATADGDTVYGSATVTVVDVEPTPVYSIALDCADYTFAPAVEGYEAQDYLEVRVTNTGNMDTGELLISSSDTASAFFIEPIDISDITVGAYDVFQITPETGLSAGTYTDTITVSDSSGYGIDESLNVSFTVNPAPVYPLMVNGGSGSGTYTAGANVTITATVPYGKQFVGWTILPPVNFTDGTSAADATATFVMPARAVTATAVYETIAQQEEESYTVTVSGSYAATTGAGSYQQGITVTIYAGQRSDYVFDGWTSEDGVIFTNSSSATTTFIMPENNVRVTANWRYDGGDTPAPVGGGGGGGGGGVAQTVPAQSGEVQVNYTRSGRTVTLEIPSAKADEIIEEAVGSRAMLDVSRLNNVDTITLPASALAAFAKARLDTEIRLADGTIILSDETAASVAEQTSSSNISIELRQVPESSLNEAQRKAIKSSDMVVDINIFSGTQKISTFNGNLTVTVPYSGSLPVAVWYLNNTGVLEKLDSTYNAATGTVSFALSHLSLYVLGLDTDTVTDVWVNPFTDVSGNDWYYGDVEYVVKNGLFNGTSATTFSPQTPMTRGMLVTVLGRLAGVDANKYTGSSFNDVGASQYYAPYIEWAKELGIAAGVGGNDFAPNREISRQDLAVILYRYSQKMGIALAKENEFISFADEANIASYAKEAVATMQQAGIVSGKPGNLFDAKGSATRAEVAAMLHRFTDAI